MQTVQNESKLQPVSLPLDTDMGYTQSYVRCMHINGEKEGTQRNEDKVRIRGRKISLQSFYIR